MSTLIFYDADHKYTVDNVEVPSVSELTRFLTREVYSETPQYFMDSAANRGTNIHKATEALDKYGKIECDSDIAGYVNAYVAFRKTCNPEWDQIEWAVNNELRYAGTLDRYGKMNGLNVIVDIKSTANITWMHKVLYRAQLNLYRLAIVKKHPVDAMWILQLKKDGTYKLIQIDVDEDLANACITMHEAMKKPERKKKKDD